MLLLTRLAEADHATRPRADARGAAALDGGCASADARADAVLRVVHLAGRTRPPGGEDRKRGRRAAGWRRGAHALAEQCK